MKVFIDTNILIDFIARREQFYQTAANLINLGIKGDIKLYATPLSYATQCNNALFAAMPDFEDMLQFESAYAAGCDVIITRNKKHFPQDAIQLLEPEEFFNCYWPQ